MQDGRVCTSCKNWFPSNFFYIGKRNTIRSQCKDCTNKATLNLYKKKRNQKDLDFIISRMASGLLSRVSSHPHYTKNGIKNLLGSHKEITDLLNQHFISDIKKLLEKGESPSIDRIDNQGHYELKNIRVISLRKNALLGLQVRKEQNKKPLKCTYPNGDIAEFESLKVAHKITGLDRKTIRDSANLNRKTRAGYFFTFIQQKEAN